MFYELVYHKKLQPFLLERVVRALKTMCSEDLRVSFHVVLKDI